MVYEKFQWLAKNVVTEKGFDGVCEEDKIVKRRSRTQHSMLCVV